MQQRLFDRGVIEIAGLQPEEEVRSKGHRGGCRTEELQPFRRQQIVQGRDRGQCDHHVERGQQPADAALVESRKGEGALAHFLLDDPGDQETGNDEEDIDADEAAENARRLEVESDHRQNGERAQGVDIFAVSGCHADTFVLMPGLVPGIHVL